MTTALLGVAVAILALAVHEAGHLVAGLAVGFEFSLFAIGPLLVERTPEGRIRSTWNRVPSFFGGAAATRPRGSDRLRGRMAAMVAGGPCASALLAAGAAAVLAWHPPPPGWPRSVLSWVRLLSAAVFVGTMIPLPNGPFVTDGLRLLRILDRGPRGQRELALLSIEADERAGVRPRSWDAAAIARGTALRDGSVFECQSQLYAYMHALDAGRLEEAGTSLDRALSLRVPAVVGAVCLVEAAYFEAGRRGDSTRARGYLERASRASAHVQESDRLRAKAAIAVAEGDVHAAREALARALATCPPWASGPRAWLAALADAVGSSSPPSATGTPPAT